MRVKQLSRHSRNWWYRTKSISNSFFALKYFWTAPLQKKIGCFFFMATGPWSLLSCILSRLFVLHIHVPFFTGLKSMPPPSMAGLVGQGAGNLPNYVCGSGKSNWSTQIGRLDWYWQPPCRDSRRAMCNHFFRPKITQVLSSMIYDVCAYVRSYVHFRFPVSWQRMSIFNIRVLESS